MNGMGKCTVCFYTHNIYSGENISTEKVPGQIAVCPNCGNVDKVTNDLSLHPLTKQELAEIKVSHPDLYKSIAHFNDTIGQVARLN